MAKLMKLILLYCLLAFTTAIQADDAALALLDQTNLATKQLNYDGVFAVQKGEKSQTIRIIHRADEQGETERLVSLSGIEQEFIRTNDLVTCIYPEGKRPQANRQPLGKGFPVDLLSRIKLAAAYYQPKLGKQERVAGHQAQELIVSPIDHYRYGYRLWVEQQRNLLLQADLLDVQGGVLEKFAFSSVDINTEISDSLLQPQMRGNEMSWKRKPLNSTVNIVTPLTTNWQVAWLPEGFNLISHQNRFARNGAPLEQRVYSDGLSSISVFIEKMRARHSHLHGGSRMGPVNAFGSIINAYFVTVVGEVPAHTVEKVGSAIAYVEGQ